MVCPFLRFPAWQLNLKSFLFCFSVNKICTRWIIFAPLFILESGKRKIAVRSTSHPRAEWVRYAVSSRANVINLLAGEASIIFRLLRTPHEDTFTRDGWGMSQLFPTSPALLNNFCQSPHFSHSSGHRSLEKVRRGVGDFNLVSTSSNLKGRTGGVREGGETLQAWAGARAGGNIIGAGESWAQWLGEREGDRERGREGNKPGNGKLCAAWLGPVRAGAGRVTWPGPGPETLHWSLMREQTRGLRLACPAARTQENWK